MQYCPYKVLRAGSVACLFMPAAFMPACAQTKYETTYGISVARISMGTVKLSIELDKDTYRISATGTVAGFVGVLSGGEGLSVTRGTIADHFIPKSYRSKSITEQEASSVDIDFDHGTVKTVVATPISNERVPLMPEHQRGVLDPLTAMTFPAGLTGEMSANACDRTLSIFDGFQRFDVKLSFKRIDTVGIHDGNKIPAIVCSAKYIPIAGRRASSMLVGYLSGRAMELTLVQLKNASVLTPLRLSVQSMVADLLVEATDIESLADTAEGKKVSHLPVRKPGISGAIGN